MPDLKRTIDIIFNGVDSTSKGTRSAINNLDKFSSVVQSTAGPLSNVTTNLLQFDAALFALSATLGGYAFIQANKFSAAQADLRKVMDDSDGPVDRFNDTIFNLSNTYGVAADNIIASAANFKQAGFSVDESFQLVKNSLDLVVAGDIEAAEASELLISALKGFNAPASEAARLVDILNEVSNKYATNVNELGIGMAILAPIAKTTNLTFEETAGILTPIIEVFRSGSEAATALKTGLLRLVDDNPTIVAALDSINVSQRNLNGELRPAKDILFDVSQEFKSLDQNNKLFIASQLVGINQAAKMVTVFDNLSKTSAVTKDALNANGSAAREVAIRLADAEIKVKRAAISFQNLGIVIGQQFNVSLADAVGGIGHFANTMQDVVSSGGLDPLLKAIAPQLAEFEKNVRAAADVLPEAFKDIDFSDLLSSLDGLSDEVGDVFTNLFGDFDLTTVEGMQKAIQKTVNIISALVNTTKGIISEFQPIFAAIGEAAERTGETGSAAQVAAGQILGAMKLLTSFGTVLGSAVVIIKESGSDINNVFDVISGTIKVLVNSLQVTFDLIALNITRSLQKINSAASVVTFGDLSDKYKKQADDLKILGDGIEANLVRNANEARDGIDQIGQGFSLIEREAKKSGDSSSESINKIAEATKKAEREIKKAEDTIKGMTRTTKDFVVTNDQAGLSTDQLAAAVKKYGDNFKVVNGLVIPTLKDLTKETKNANDITKAFSATNSQGLKVYTETGKLITDFGGALSLVSKESKTAKKDTDDFLTKMEEIASNERIKTLEFAVDLQIAQLETDAKKLDTIFKSIDNTVTSTGEVISSALGVLGDFKGVSQFDAAFKVIKNQLDIENKARQEAFEVKRRLAEAEIRLINEKTNALKNGGALINISSDGLEQHLEAIMFEIIKKVQVRGNAEYVEYLMGIN